MKKKSLIALLLACAFSFGTASMTACNIIGGPNNDDTGITDDKDKDKTVAVTGVEVNPATLSLKKGAHQTLTATIAPTNATNKNVSWSSSNNSVATVDSDGKVTAVANGTAIITVTTADGNKTDTCEVTVEDDGESTKVSVSNISVTPNTATVTAGETKTLSATVTPLNATDKTVTWSSNNTSVATVDNNGKVTTLKAGTATITATANDGSGVKGTCTVTVQGASQNTPVTGITISPSTAALDIGGTKQLSAAVAPSDATDKTVTWASSDTSVATVNNSGLVTAKAAGTANITATANDGSGVKGTCAVTVKAAQTATQKYTVTFVSEGATVLTQEVEEGKCATIPTTVTKDGYYISGWGTNSATGANYDFSTAVTANITLHAKWTKVAEGLAYSYAGNECAAFEWGDSNPADATVKYKLSGGSYVDVDSKLIRKSTTAGNARVDIVGLKGGEQYDFEITTSANKTITVTNMQISAYDRSGYAHFGKTDGVGAYKDDGTPKSNAVIVYVNEDNKNTVTANGKTGLVDILKNASASKPLIVRVLGTVGSATWNELKYNGGKAFTDENLVKGINGKKLPTSSSQLTQKYLLENGYNTLNYTPNDSFYTARTPNADGATCTVLAGIEESSKATYKSGEYDSCWNNVSLSNLQNVTVEGIGEDARIFQWGFTWNSCKSIEVRNIKFDDYTEDACSFESGDFANGNGYYWVHHNTFEQGKNYWDVCPEQDKHEGDGATDFKRVRNITIAYNHYHDNHKTGLIGSGDDVLTANVTFHHNYYETNSSRMPLGRQANMHMYNNYYQGSTGTNMSLRGNAFALIENCYFDNANVPIELKTGAVAKVLGSIFTGKQPSTNDDLHIDTKESGLKRESQVANNNTVVGSGKYFDVDSTLFYYNSTTKTSKVENMLTAEQVKTEVPKLAGVQKHTGTVGSGSSGEGGDEGDEGNAIGNITASFSDLPKSFVDAASVKDSNNKTTIIEITEPMRYGSTPVSVVVGAGNNKWTVYNTTHIQSNGDGTMEIDLTAYTGNAEVKIVARTTGSSNTGRYYTITGNGVTLYSAGYTDAAVGISTGDQTDTFVLQCGYKYTLVCSGGLRFASFAFKATTSSPTATMTAKPHDKPQN